jgi:hypothetical protein
MACGGTALLTGCGGSQARFVPPGNIQAARAASSRSWMAPQSKSSDLLYVSDTNGRIYVYSYPAGKLVGELTGLTAPAGLCSDKAGNVFVTDTIGQGILKFAHGGKKPITGLYDVGYYPDGCAVDPATGNLAVTNYSAISGPGSVALYAGAKGIPKLYYDSAFSLYFFCSYDAHGDLYIDGVNNGTTQTEFAELPSGSSNFTNITLDRTVGYPGAVQWDGKYVAIEDASTDIVYRVKVSGSKGTTVKTLHFKGQRGDLLVQFWIDGSTIFMPYGTMYRQIRTVGLWPYPAGGSPVKAWHVTGATELYGVTLSRATRALPSR